MDHLRVLARPQHFQSAFGGIRSRITLTKGSQTRYLHKSIAPPPTPAPTPFVPNVQTFLTLIGRGLSQHASKFPTWESLFALTSNELRELGIEPPRNRRYLLTWRQKFRNGHFGIGGDFRHVQDGIAELRILEKQIDPKNPKRFVVNVPLGKSLEALTADEMVKVRGFHVNGANAIAGPYALPLKSGEGAQIAVTEGMWEDRRGHKVDGGERRRTEVRWKKRIAERRIEREKAEGR